MEFFTIGVYNSTEEAFFGKLKESKIDAFCDIRQRRGVRGAKYAFVNSKRLQSSLSELGIKYLHISGLAPPKEIRELQKEADASQKQLKRDRSVLGQVFKIAYKDRVISKFDFENFLNDLTATGAERIVLFCVEESPAACHRSLVTDKLQKLDYLIKHL